MANISTAVDESIFKIDKWLGVNQSPEGESRLKMGESADMRNFRITAGGALKKRSGSNNVAGLLNQYNVVADSTLQTLITEYGASSALLSMYPQAGTDSVGKPIGSGTSVSVDYDNNATYANYFYAHTDGELYKYASCTATARSVKETRELGYMSREPLEQWYRPWALVYDNLIWNGTEFVGTGETVVDLMNQSAPIGKYSKGNPQTVWKPYSQDTPPAASEFPAPTSNEIWKFDECTYYSADIYTGYTIKYKFSICNEAKWEWEFYGTHSESNTADKRVRGIWSGYVGGQEVLCAACNGYLWELSLDNEAGAWSKTSCGALTTDKDVFMFGFDEKLYIMNGTQYKVWDGTTLNDVTGYRPLISVSNAPTGGGTLLEQVNKLNGTRRAWFSPDGTATTFQLPESDLSSVDYVKKTADGSDVSFTADTASGIVTISPALPQGTNSIEIGWTVPNNSAASVRAMRYAEVFNGAQDSRVFLYGDGTNEAFYSGLDYNGKATAEYFPDLNEMAVGDANTPLTALIRQYGQLMAFKLDSAYTVYYDTITLADGTVTAGFKLTPVNRDIGNCALGQARLVENRPRTLDGRSVIEWKASSSYGGSDQKNAQRISQRVDRSIRTLNLELSKTFYDKLSHEYYIIGANGTALVNNIDADAWYIYTDFAATCLIRYQDELYYGTNDGYLRHCSDNYFSDEGALIDCYWESGSMAFNKDFKRKYSAMLWVGIKPENNGYLKVTAETDQKSDFAEYSFSTDSAESVPTMNRIKLKAKKFTFYKLILSNNTADKTATVVSADIRVRGTGYVR